MSDAQGSYPSIGDHAIIGNCRAAALISHGGELDWLCLPRFDAPALFAAVLDQHRGGSFVVRPSAPFATVRRYVENTTVLETTFTTPQGRLRLLDLMPVASEADKRHELWPEHEVLRIVEGLEGEVDVEVLCDPRPRYGAVVPQVIDRGRLGICFGHGAEVLVLHSDIPLERSADQPGVRGHAGLRPGERRYVSLTYTQREPAVLPMSGEAAERTMTQTIGWWQTWAARCRYQGAYRSAVVRSALTLKLLTYAPSGAVVAAPTTALPEQIGGVRNWDYRYCWLRDASLTLRALMDLGYVEEAEAFLAWTLHATRLTWPELQILYDVHGETRLRERELTHLEGYAASRPVRIGNDAVNQLQLDTYGEVVDAVFEYVQRGGTLDRATRRLLARLGQTVCRRWREPDEGIWEVRGGRQHHTHSKAMCWVALDRLLRLDASGHVRVPVHEFREARKAIRSAIEAHGYNPQLDSYVSVFDGERVDASLLLLARYGYVEPNAPRMLATCARVHERLGKNGMLYRYRTDDDGLPPGEGAFGIASFWAVDCRSRQGAVDEAATTFEQLCALGNDVGLFAEEFDAETGAPLGNFPQAFTHVGLIDAALTLDEARGRGVRGTVHPHIHEVEPGS
jgi:GH15 family glucan-1,4-alpha-glucosidase